MNLFDQINTGFSSITAMPDWAMLLSKVTLFLTAAWLIHILLSRFNPRFRVLHWRGVTIGLLLLFTWGLALPAIEIPVSTPKTTAVVLVDSPSIIGRENVLSDFQETENIQNFQNMEPASVVTQTAQTTGKSRDPISWHVIALGIWCFGVFSLLTRLGISLLRLKFLLKDSLPATDEIVALAQRIGSDLGYRQPVEIRTSARFTVPILYGVLRPVMILPERMCEQDFRGELPAILAHELTHASSRDVLWNAAVQLIRTLLWFHPFAWKIGEAHRAACDAVCDAVSANYLGDVQAYCRTLASVALEANKIGFVGVLCMANRCDVRRRIAALQRVICANRLRKRTTISLTCIALLTTSFLASVQLTPAVAEDPNFENRTEEKAKVKKLAPPKEQTSSVSGSVVLGNKDAAISNAKVYLFRRPKGSYSLPMHPLRTSTEQDGTFKFDEVPSGKYRLWSERGPLTSLKKKFGGVEITIPKNAAPIKLKLHEGCRFDIAVRSKLTGKPLPGAKVTFGWTDIEREFIAGDDGVVHVVGIAPHEWTFKIFAPNYAMQFKRIKQMKPGVVKEFSFDLEPGGEIVGNIKDEQGKPIVNAKVHATNRAQSWRQSYGQVLTDAHGQFRIPNITRKTKIVVGTPPDGYLGTHKEIGLGPDQSQVVVNLIVKKRPYGGDVIVTVVDENGTPVEGAKLVNEGNSSNLKHTALSDTNGKARINNIYGNIYGKAIVVNAKGFALTRINVEAGTQNSPANIRVPLKRGYKIKGRILLPSGKPGKNLQVRHEQSEYAFSKWKRVNTDSEGRFEFNGLNDGYEFDISVPDGCAPFRRQKFPVGQDDEVVIQLTPEGIIRSKVFDSKTGRKIEAYNVRVTSARRKPGEPSMGILFKWFKEGFNIKPTDEEFRLGGFPPGMPLMLTISAPGYETKILPRVVAALEEKARFERIELTAVDPSSYQTISGVIQRADGTPVVGSLARLVVGKSAGGLSSVSWSTLEGEDITHSAECIQYLTTTSDKKGNFTFTQVRPGKWLEVFCTGDGIAATRRGGLQDLSKKELLNLKLTVQNPGSLRVKIDHNKWPKAYMVQLSQKSSLVTTKYGFISVSRTSSVSTYARDSKYLKGNENEVLFEGLPPGYYRLSLETAYGKSPAGILHNEKLQRATITIKAGENAKYNFDK